MYVIELGSDISSMKNFLFAVWVAAAVSSISCGALDRQKEIYPFPFHNRTEWNARPYKERTDLQYPVPFVVIHHSYTPKACYTTDKCEEAMRGMQNYHMDHNGWWDIGYNFAVGSDGAAYEGRGWTTLGAHALHFNNVSIGICLIGDWTESVPPKRQLEIAQSLIEVGVDLGYIKPEYKLVGHRQVRETECPGESLYKEIETWPHYSHFPRSVDDLPNVPELHEENNAL